MAKSRYQARVCDGDVCKDAGKATRSIEQAKKRMVAAQKKLAKKAFRKLPGQDELRAVHGEVWETQRGQNVGDKPVFIGAEAYGSPNRLGARRRRRAPTEG